MRAEERLRQRIRQVLIESGFEPSPNSLDTNDFENQILNLFQEFMSAPEDSRRKVYARGEKRILERLRASRVNSRRRTTP